MSVLKKLLVATAIVAAGFGVAILLGHPVALPSAKLPPVAKQPPAAITDQPIATGEGSWLSMSAQLLPEPKQTSSVATPSLEIVAAPPLPSQLAPITSLPHEPTPNALTPLSNLTAIARPDDSIPRDETRGASLRNEAPRPIGSEPRGTATIRRAPDPNATSTVANPNPYQTNTTGSTPNLVPVNFAGVEHPSANAMYNTPATTPSANALTAPLLPVEDDSDAPRSHVISDGDSLEKLAGRYLGDTRRASELFELNRGLLANPEVLPIGVEIKLPVRQSLAGFERQTTRAESASRQTTRETVQLVPVRPLSAVDAIVPQATLCAPLPVD